MQTSETTGMALFAALILLGPTAIIARIPTEITVSVFWGEDSYLQNADDIVLLQYYIQPSTTEVHKLHCYNDVITDDQHRFYSFDPKSGATCRNKDIGNRTEHALIELENQKVFQLMIFKPRMSDVGDYVCLLDTAEIPDGSAQLKARLKLKRSMSSDSEEGVKWIWVLPFLCLFLIVCVTGYRVRGIRHEEKQRKTQREAEAASFLQGKTIQMVVTKPSSNDSVGFLG